MDPVHPLDRKSFLRWAPARAWRLALIALAVVSVVLFIAVLVSNLQTPTVSALILIAVTAAFSLFSILLAKFFVQLRSDQRRAASALQATETEFHQMAGNIQEIFWLIDADSKKALFVNPAYETITGRSCQSLLENPTSYTEVIHPDDRSKVLAKLDAAARNGQFDERFRIVRPSGEVRWVWARGSPVRDAEGRIHRLVGTVLEVTAQKEAEEQLAANLALAESSWAEADALRKATLGLTQDLRMDFVLDALLQSLADLIPYTCARVLITEGGPHVLSLGERLRPPSPESPSEFPLTLNADESPFLRRILSGQKSVLIPDARQEDAWPTFTGHAHLRSWLSVPLVASGQYLGFLSVGHTEPNRFAEDHLRRAELLAIAAAAAIQNSRLYERARIFGEELERRIEDLRRAQAALAQSEEGRRVSEQKFQQVFGSSPIPFSITTLTDGRFLDVNPAFEHRYGYSRAEVLGRTVHELGIWEDPSDRALMVAQLQQGPIRNVITRLRMKSGEIKAMAYSADKILFDGQTCVLAVSEDLPGDDKHRSN
jgi:PAS domain S-box-containing protein